LQSPQGKSSQLLNYIAITPRLKDAFCQRARPFMHQAAPQHRQGAGLMQDADRESFSRGMLARISLKQ
jgi:hypothetical protein